MNGIVTYKLAVDVKPGYLHVVVTGQNSKENVAQYLERLRRECAARDCFRVLVEERLEGPRLETMDVFQIASNGSERARGQLMAIAYVDANADGGSMQFAETVAVNRGLPVRVFSTVADAEEWLQSLDR